MEAKKFLHEMRIDDETIYDRVEGKHSLECLLDDFAESQSKEIEELKKINEKWMDGLDLQIGWLEKSKKENEELKDTKYKEQLILAEFRDENTKLKEHIKDLKELVVDYDNGARNLLREESFREYSHILVRKENLLNKE